MTVRGGEVLGPRRGTRGMSLFPDSRRGLAGWGGGGGAGSETDGGDPKSPQLPVQRERERETGNVGSDGPTYIRPSVSYSFLRNEIIECLAPHNVAQD